MSEQTEVERAITELTEQRDFLLVNTHVKEAPRLGSNTGCLVQRCTGRGVSTVSAGPAMKSLMWALMEMGVPINLTPALGEGYILLGTLNDEFLDAGAAIAALDRAIVICKELLYV